jgi:hypothetical protein
MDMKGLTLKSGKPAIVRVLMSIWANASIMDGIFLIHYSRYDPFFHRSVLRSLFKLLATVQVAVLDGFGDVRGTDIR